MTEDESGGPKGLDMGKLIETARQMAGKLSEVQEELAGISVEGSAGGGLVKAQANGRGELLDQAGAVVADHVIAALEGAGVAAGEQAVQADPAVVARRPGVLEHRATLRQRRESTT